MTDRKSQAIKPGSRETTALVRRILSGFGRGRGSAALLSGLRLIFFHRSQERFAAVWRLNLATENRGKRHHFPEENSSLILVLGNARSAEVNSSEHPPRAGISQHLGFHFPIGTGFALSVHRYGSCGGVGR